jgi:hypothetical protein
MSRRPIDLPLAERTGAYWQACQALRISDLDRWQYWRAQRVMVVLARCEATYRLRMAARRMLAGAAQAPKPSQGRRSQALPLPGVPGDLAS